MTVGAADFLADPAHRIVVVQNIAQMEQMSVAELPEGALIQVAQYFGGLDAGVGTMFRFTRSTPSIGSLVFGTNLVDAAGDGFFYRFPQRGSVLLAAGVGVVTGAWLGSSPSLPQTFIQLAYLGPLVAPGFLSISAASQIGFTVASSDAGDASTVGWMIHL